MSIKRTARDKLKTKFDGIDEKVLGRIAVKIAKTAKTDDDVQSEVDDLTLMDIINSYTDSRVNDAQAKAVERYKQEQGIKSDGDGDGTEEGDGDGKGEKNVGDGKGEKGEKTNDDTTPAYIKALMKSVETLTQEVTNLKAGKTADARKEALDKVLKDASERDRKFYEKNYSRMKFESDEDFSEWLDGVTDDIKDNADGTGGNGTQAQQTTQQGRPKAGGGGGGAIPAQVQARIDARSKAATVVPAIKGLPTTNNV